MSKHPLLSVVIPVYNVELYVEDAIRSVINQDFADYEIIVINDGSTDESVTLVEKIMLKEKRIRLYHQGNQGLAATRNRGLDMASGRYIYFLDADDMLKPNVLTNIMNRIQITESELVYFPGQFLNAEGNTFTDKPDFFCFEQKTPVSGELLFTHLTENGCYSPNVQKYIYTKKFLLHRNLRFEDGFSHEDEAFSIKALCLADKAVSFRQTLMYKRLRPNSIMSTEKALHNVQGWLQAATSIVLFSESRKLHEGNKQFIRNRAKSMIITAKKIARDINRKKKTRISIDDHIPKETLDKLGSRFKFRLKFDRFFGILNRLTT